MRGPPGLESPPTHPAPAQPGPSLTEAHGRQVSGGFSGRAGECGAGVEPARGRGWR